MERKGERVLTSPLRLPLSSSSSFAVITRLPASSSLLSSPQPSRATQSSLTLPPPASLSLLLSLLVRIFFLPKSELASSPATNFDPRSERREGGKEEGEVDFPAALYAQYIAEEAGKEEEEEERLPQFPQPPPPSRSFRPKQARERGPPFSSFEQGMRRKGAPPRGRERASLFPVPGLPLAGGRVGAQFGLCRRKRKEGKKDPDSSSTSSIGRSERRRRRWRREGERGPLKKGGGGGGGRGVFSFP